MRKITKYEIMSGAFQSILENHVLSYITNHERKAINQGIKRIPHVIWDKSLLEKFVFKKKDIENKSKEIIFLEAKLW